MKEFMNYSVGISAIVLALCAIYCSWCYYNYSKTISVSLSGKIGAEEYVISGKLPDSEISNYIWEQTQELIEIRNDYYDKKSEGI